jgi:hypothetical protein
MGYSSGDRVRFKQVTHGVPLTSSSGFIEVHENPKSGVGSVQFVSRVGDEWRLFVLPDDELRKTDKSTLLLRVPPDTVELLG